MKNLSWITAAIAAVMLNGTSARAAELPTFGLMGFPITPHQVAVLGSAHVQEQAPTPTLTFGGMPASPHQLTVLTPRSKATAAAALATTGSSSADPLTKSQWPAAAVPCALVTPEITGIGAFASD